MPLITADNANTKILTPRQQDQRTRVLESTREMLADEGYDGLQMRLLAERSGVSLMTLYNRFGNKDDLILVALQDVLTAIAEQSSASGQRGIERLLRLTTITSSQIMATPKYARAMASMLFNARADSPICTTLLTDVVQDAHEYIAEMCELGELKTTIDPELLARNLGVCRWSAILLWMKQIHSDSEFERQYRCAPLLVLAGAMTPATLEKYAPLLACD